MFAKEIEETVNLALDQETSARQAKRSTNLYSKSYTQKSRPVCRPPSRRELLEQDNVTDNERKEEAEVNEIEVDNRNASFVDSDGDNANDDSEDSVIDFTVG